MPIFRSRLSLGAMATVHLPKRLPPTARGMLVWFGVVTALFALFFLWAALRPSEELTDLALRLYVIALPAGVLRRRPVAGMAAMIAAFFLLGASDSWDPTFLQVIALQAAVGFIAATRRPLISLPVATATLLAELAAAYLNFLPNPQVSTTPATLLAGVLISV